MHERHPPKMIVLDMDSSVSPTHGDQEGSAYNGHFGCSCYHPLFVFNQFGDRNTAVRLTAVLALRARISAGFEAMVSI